MYSIFSQNMDKNMENYDAHVITLSGPQTSGVDEFIKNVCEKSIAI